MKVSSVMLFIFCLFTSFRLIAGNPDTLMTDTNRSIFNDLSSFIFNDLIINPALTGIDNRPAIQLKADVDKPFYLQGALYRSQQYEILSDIAFGKNKNNAMGCYFIAAKGGATAMTTLGLSYAHNFNLFRKSSFYHKLRIGGSIDLNALGYDYNRITFGDQINPRYGFVYYTQETKPGDLNKGYLSINLGMCYHNPLFHLEASVSDITQPNMGLYSVAVIPRTFNLSGGAHIKLNDDFTVHPSFLVNAIDGYNGTLNSYEPFLTGQYQEKLFLGVSYKDLNKITLHGGGVIFKCVTLSAAFGFSTISDLDGFGSPAYIGGDIRMNFNKIIN